MKNISNQVKYCIMGSKFSIKEDNQGKLSLYMTTNFNCQIKVMDITPDSPIVEELEKCYYFNFCLENYNSTSNPVDDNDFEKILENANNSEWR